MKKFLLSSIALVTVFMIGCDTNVYQPIMRNQEFVLSKVGDRKPQHFTTDTHPNTKAKITETFTHSVVGNKLFLTNTFAFGNPGDIASMGISSVDNSTSTITLTYRDSLGMNPVMVPGTTTPLKKGVEITSIFDITQVRMGNGRKIKVNVNYEFPNSSTNVLPLTLNKSYTLPY
jgi:uncharacterized protein YcfL